MRRASQRERRTSDAHQRALRVRLILCTLTEKQGPCVATNCSVNKKRASAPNFSPAPDDFTRRKAHRALTDDGHHFRLVRGRDSFSHRSLPLVGALSDSRRAVRKVSSTRSIVSPNPRANNRSCREKKITFPTPAAQRDGLTIALFARRRECFVLFLF